MKRLGKMGIILILSFVVVNISFADSHKDKSHYKKLLGTWLVTNETVDSTYDGTIGQITFYDDYLTIDFGRFAAAGIAAASEDVSCHLPFGKENQGLREIFINKML